MESTNEPEQPIAELPAPQRNFVIPGCSVVIHCEDDEGMPVQELLAIVFGLAGSNPEAKVDFWLKVLS